MKKRAMKKWIPRNTRYCYKMKNGKTIKCKWLRISKKHDIQENGYCIYLNMADWQENGSDLLWDECKECKFE